MALDLEVVSPINNRPVCQHACQLLQKEAASRLKRRKKQSEDDPEDLLVVEQDMKDQAVIDQPERTKPELPKKFNERLVREKVDEKFKQIKRRPGEPILAPEISFATNVTSLQHCPL